MPQGKGTKNTDQPTVAIYPDSLTTKALLKMFAEYNPRKMSEHDFEILKRSLQKFELVQAIVVNRRSAECGWPEESAPAVVGGHQRIRAASEVGMKDCAVRWVNLDQASERELNVVMNRNAGEFDDPMLEQVLQEIDRLGGDVTMSGFTSEELEKYLQSFTAGGGDLPNMPAGSGFVQMTFILSDAQGEVVTEAIGRGVKHLSGPDSSGNENKNGNALHLICSEYDG